MKDERALLTSVSNIRQVRAATEEEELRARLHSVVAPISSAVGSAVDSMGRVVQTGRSAVGTVGGRALQSGKSAVGSVGAAVGSVGAAVGSVGAAVGSAGAAVGSSSCIGPNACVRPYDPSNATCQRCRCRSRHCPCRAKHAKYAGSCSALQSHYHCNQVCIRKARVTCSSCGSGGGGVHLVQTVRIGLEEEAGAPRFQPELQR